MQRNGNRKVKVASRPYQVATLTAQEPWQRLLRPIEPPAGEVGVVEGSETVFSETELILFALAQAVEQRDRHTACHCERMAFVSVAMGIYMGMDQADLLALYRGGYLHDVGKVGIPDSILFKAGKLDAEEWDVMRTHPVRGVEICRHLKTFSTVIPIIRHHHERWDGSGYPDGLRGEAIPITARVVQIADIYDALTSPRTYKEAFSPERALSVIQDETDRGWRDPAVVRLFFTLHKNVISKASQYGEGDVSLEAMRSALLSLHLGA